MWGIWGYYSGEFLSVVGWLTLIVFSIPITIWPFQWARFIGWEIPEKTELALYFGRCLGCLAIGVSVFTLIAANDISVQPFFFKLLLTIYALMVILHIYGAIQKIQPIAETLEIGFWLILTLLTLAFWPTGP